MKDENIDITDERLIEFAENIIVSSKYNIKKEDADKFNLYSAKYFIENATKCFINRDENGIANGILFASIDHESPKKFWIDENLFTDKHSREFVKFQKRIMKCIEELDTIRGAEIICFSVLKKSSGIGKLLLNQFESYLKSIGINNYHLFTDENCSYDWYIKNDFKLIMEEEVDISDLMEINNGKSTYKIMAFNKLI